MIVRHAEKDAAGDPRDPGLSAAGAERARSLARLLSRSRVSHLFASELKRTQETLAPLAGKTGLRVEIVPAAKGKELADKLRALPGGAVAVVAGHSNTVPAIVAALGAEVKDLEPTPQGPMLADTEYGRIFAVTLLPPTPGGRRACSVLELSY